MHMKVLKNDGLTRVALDKITGKLCTVHRDYAADEQEASSCTIKECN
jgi:hypothetical protein